VVVSREQFNLEQLALVRRRQAGAEARVARHFRIPALPSSVYPFEVVTLGDMAGDERAEDALAHLLIYERPRARGVEHLYRICLQDDVILRRSQEAAGLAREGALGALLSYVLTHELVHVVRFQRGEQRFDEADRRSRDREEQRVHQLTLDLLRREPGLPDPDRFIELLGMPAEQTTVVQAEDQGWPGPPESPLVRPGGGLI
jgi:hypothetical protein